MEPLTKKESQAWEKIQAANFPKTWGFGIKEELLADPTPEKIRSFINELVSQWQDNAGMMFEILGFDLPKMLGVKMYSRAEINYKLSRAGMPYCVVREIAHTRLDGQWIAQAGQFNYKDFHATIYVDDWLTRYMRVDNGQFFECSNDDLSALSRFDKEGLLKLLNDMYEQ